MSKEGATTSLVLHSTVALDKASYHCHLNYSDWNVLQNLLFFEAMLETTTNSERLLPTLKTKFNKLKLFGWLNGDISLNYWVKCLSLLTTNTMMQ